MVLWPWLCFRVYCQNSFKCKTRQKKKQQGRQPIRKTDTQQYTPWKPTTESLLREVLVRLRMELPKSRSEDEVDFKSRDTSGLQTLSSHLSICPIISPYLMYPYSSPSKYQHAKNVYYIRAHYKPHTQN